MRTEPGDIGIRTYTRGRGFDLVCSCGATTTVEARTYDDGRRLAREAGWSLPRFGSACPECKGAPPAWSIDKPIPAESLDKTA